MLNRICHKNDCIGRKVYDICYKHVHISTSIKNPPPPKKNKYSKKMLTTKSLINLVPFKKSSAIQD